MAAAIENNAQQRIQTISDRVWEKYEELQEMPNLTVNTKLAIKKTTKVNIEAIKRNLTDFKNLLQDKELKVQIDGICHDLDNMPFDGTTKLFTVHNVRHAISNSIEFMCCAVRRYEYKGQYLCDYCLSTFTYSKFIDYTGIAVRTAIRTLGVVLGAISITVFNSTTGIDAPHILAIAGGYLGTSIAGSVTIASNNTDFDVQFRDILEASFIYELVQRGHAIIQDRTMFITHN